MNDKTDDGFEIIELNPQYAKEIEEFFRIQSKIDELSYKLVVMESFLVAHKCSMSLAKGVFWDEVASFYRKIAMRALRIADLAEHFLKIEIEGGECDERE